MRLTLVFFASALFLSACTPSLTGIVEQAIAELAKPQFRILERPHVATNLSGILDRRAFGGAHRLVSEPLPARDVGPTVNGGIEREFPQPDKLNQTAIELIACTELTLRELEFHHFKVGIFARNCENLVLENLTFSDMFRQRLHSTPDREDTRDWLWPHNNDNREWMTNYGACIVLENCKNCVIRNCSAKGTQNGIILDKCEGCQVYNNDFSYCSGWGCALWRSNKNTVAQNRFDYCVRGYSDGVYARGQDSAGILVFEQCCDNVFAYNSATHSGDGFFLYAGHETTQRTGKGGCNRNLVYGNDFSYAVANGIEATFSDGNVFAKNRLIGCDYGIWGGYSYNTLISGNNISSRTDIAIEHGHDNWIEGNRFRGNCGVALWWDDDKDLTAGVYGKNQITLSARTTIKNNNFECYRALSIVDTSDTLIEGNQIDEDPHLSGTTPLAAFLGAKGKVSGLHFVRNNIEHYWPPINSSKLHLDADSPKIEFGENYCAPPRDSLPEGCTGEPTQWPKQPYILDLGKLDRPVTAPAHPAAMPPTLREYFETGHIDSPSRDAIVVGPWGPVNVADTQPGLTELSFGDDAKGTGVHWVLKGRGTGEPSDWRCSIDDSFTWKQEYLSGFVQRFTIAIEKEGTNPYELSVTASNTIKLRGTVTLYDWTVRFWKWTPVKNVVGPPNWDEMVKGEPVQTTKRTQLYYSWHDEPAFNKGPADYFATVATTEIELPAGSWKLVLTSDDGARLFVDGEKVIERWDIHGPTDDAYTLKLEKPRLVKLRVEHFENTGWAALALRIERAD